MQTERARFSTPAIILHWAIAAVILANIYLGLKMGGLTPGPDGTARVRLVEGLPLVWSVQGSSAMVKFQTFQLHKSLGFTILGLTVLRLGLRLFGGRPPHYPAEMARWEKAVASATHWGFYFLMLALPLTGWVIVSASPTNIPTLLYKALPFPHLGFVHGLPMETRRALEGGTTEVHELLAWITIALLFLHVGAALKHQFWTKDAVLYRMLPLPFLKNGRPVLTTESDSKAT